MTPVNVSECGRFVVIDGLHLDRSVFETLRRWAADRGVRIQDALQLAVCSFNERHAERSGAGTSPKRVFRILDSSSPEVFRRSA
jgi:hypothetical protein